LGKKKEVKKETKQIEKENRTIIHVIEKERQPFLAVEEEKVLIRRLIM
jgi:hypothetical protein